MRDRKFKRVFICLLAVLVLAVSSLSVFAKEFTEEDGEALVESCKRYIESLYTYDDTELEEMKDLGDFYLVTSEMVTSEKEELGDFIGVLDGGTCDIANDGITIHIPAKYEKYTADIMLTFDPTGTEPKNFVINPDYSLGEKMSGALSNFVLGIIIVFVMLLFLAFVISLLKFVNPDVRKERKLAKAKKEAAERGAAAEAAAAEKAAEETAAAAEAPETASVAAAMAGDSELIAVMAAAIAAAEAEGAGGSYVVRSIRRIGTRGNWTRS